MKINEIINREAITAREASVLMGMSEGTLANMRCRREGPRFYKMGGKIIYRISDIENFLFKNPVTTSDQE